MTERIPAKDQRLVRERAKHLCEYCVANSQYAFHPFTIDHVTPLGKGGNSDISNLALACQNCNNSKYNKTECLDPMTGKLVPLYHPRKDSWRTHFRWHENETIILGITPTGRATVTCLKLNRVAAINLREALKSYGVHPPNSDYG